MLFLDKHRKAATGTLCITTLTPPFSFFDLVEDKFGNCDSIRRIFSLARAFNAEMLIHETISPEGIVTEENEDILKAYPDYINNGLVRLSFWKKTIGDDISTLTNGDLVGYAICKQDIIENIGFDQWHIFEAVFVKYPHAHNCVPKPQTYHIAVCDQPFQINGIIYCQQNTLNKACAQVALRSLLSRVLPEADISYRRINEIADDVTPGFNPCKGLSVPQIRHIFNKLGINFTDIDYTEHDDKTRKDLPYQKYAYAGLEAGYGALVGFRLAGKDFQQEAKHIIPIYGHTFNKDTWVPNADISYFHIGEGVGYVPSESWTSSFLGHDDNFGANFCIPRLYIENDKVDYVVEIYRPGVFYGGVQAEALALLILYSLLPCLDATQNKWISRLLEWTGKQQVVFRALSMTSSEYVEHLNSLRDWDNNRERPELCEFLRKELPDYIWVIEISTPQLFPANERKLGDIVLDATQPLNMDDSLTFYNVFTFARLPRTYLLGGEIENGSPKFKSVPSALLSHTELVKF